MDTKGYIGNKSYVTVATNDTYCLGVLVLAQSLMNTKTKYPIVCCVTDEVSQEMRETLKKVVHQVIPIYPEKLESIGPSEYTVMAVTLTKLLIWTLTDFTKCIYIDADCLVLTNIDELFEREELSAAPDRGWPSCFNSGVFVYRPSQATWKNLLQLVQEEGSFDGGDQGVLNTYFSDWSSADISKRLPYVYNTLAIDMKDNAAYRKCADDIKVLHFIGGIKPWHHKYDEVTGSLEPHPENTHDLTHLRRWWLTFTKLKTSQPNIYLPAFSSLCPVR